MATHAPKMNGSKPSFASIAAMAAPAQAGRGLIVREENLRKTANTTSPALSTKATVAESPSASQLHGELRTSMSRLVVREKSPSSSPMPEHDQRNSIRVGLKCDDDQTQISSSSTKPASLDGKSATSGTTFALDEKESLRPDDSASVKAADDEDLYSGPASGAASSRVGSEAGSRAFRDQFYEISERMGPGPHRSYPVSRRGIPGIKEEAPQMTLPPLASALPTPVVLPRSEVIAPPGAAFGFQYQEPDEKLFEALESPKDRLFLLRLEQEVITFVRDSTEPMIDLPPCNSFCRLLAHKLADYYALTHFVDNAVSSVRLYRTPYCRIPPPLSAISRQPTSTDPVSFQPTMKIMRRAGLDKDGQSLGSGPNTTENSMAPSKTGSETGDGSQRGTGVVSPTDSVAAKDKAAMTREEREAKYKETRERIFKGFEDNDPIEAADANEVSNEVSRASSVNEKKKKKQRNHDDGFEARSKFNAYYPTLQYPASTYDQPVSPATYYSPYSGQPHLGMNQAAPLSAPMLQQPYPQGYQAMQNPPAFSMPMQQIPLMNASTFSAQTVNPTAFPGYHQATQYYQPIQPQIPMGPHSPAMSSPALSNNVQLSRPQSQMSDQQWPQGTYPYPYQRPREQQQYYPPAMHDQTSTGALHPVPYPYGQLPYQSSVQGGRAPHPLPGSYTRQTFNPQIRAFVPGSGNTPQTMSYGGRPNEPTARAGMMFSNGNLISPYGRHPDACSQIPSGPTQSAFNPSHDSKPYSSRKTSAHTNGPTAPLTNSLSKWGTPAHLPPKPPPSAIASLPEGQHSLPPNVHASINTPPLSNGLPMPNFQNGVYSMPSVGTK